MNQPPPGPYYPPQPSNQPPHQPPQQPPQQVGLPMQQPWPPQQPPPHQQQPWPPQQPLQQQWGPGPQQQWPQPARPPGPGLGTHLKRAVDWNLAAIVPTPREEAALAAAGVEPRLRGMLVWRRSALLIALPLLVLSVVLGIIDAVKQDTDGFTGFGKLWLYLPTLGLFFAPIGAIAVLRNWTDMRRSTRVLIVFWVASIAIPLVVALFPLDFILDLDSLRQRVVDAGGDVAAFDQYILGARSAMAVAYALTLLPVVVTIPGGVLKGAARIKSLFPAAGLPGWFLVGVAPFYSLFTVVIFVLVDQIVGNALLLFGVAFLVFSPWLFVIHRRVYGRPLSMAEAASELPRASRVGGLLFALGLTLICIYLVTGEVNHRDILGTDSDKAYFTYLDILRTLAELFSRMLVTTVVFSAIVLSMIFAEWKNVRELRPDIRAEHDDQMRAVERYMTSPTAPAQATWATGSTS